ncbi:MAG: hypothetical protein JRH20_05560 [Deltaproteobacteria bacterium]|nr:hypothetical protein [Deltaproteobacteria bacterium]
MADEQSSVMPVPFTGRAGRTRRKSIQVGCDCGHGISAEVHVSIDVSESPEVAEGFLEGGLKRVICPSCGREHALEAPVVVHDPRIPLFSLLIPPALRHREMQLTATMLTAIGEEGVDVPLYVKRPEVFYERGTLIEALQRVPATLHGSAVPCDDTALVARESELEQREEDLFAREENLLAREERLIALRQEVEQHQHLLDRDRKDLERERQALRALAMDLSTREQALRERSRVQPPPPPPEAFSAAEEKEGGVLKGRPEARVNQWRASQEQVTALVHEGEVFLLARPGEALAALREKQPKLLVQLHLLEGLPVVALALREADEGASSLFWPLDVRNEEHVAVLEQLAERFAVRLDLYDDESRPVVGWQLEAPLEQNAAQALRRAHEALEALGGAEQLDFEVACRTFDELGDERLGRKRHNFSEESFIELPSPAAARLALGITTYWSEEQNEDYLIFVKSFPLQHWREIRQRVVERALEVGLRLSPALMNFAVDHEFVDSPAQALRTALANFAEVSLRLKPCDLDPVHEWENWKWLLEDCIAKEVEVEPQIEELATASGRKARQISLPMEDETAAGGDFTLLATEELLVLLGDRGGRRDAALELCERGDPELVRPIYDALQSMTRDEVARVMPAMLSFGGATVDLLVRGLEHRKSFIRQGCALGLGSLGAISTTRDLVGSLLKEPTRIWMEVARAIGDLGASAIPMVRGGLAAADGEGRERIAWALAHIALHTEGERLLRAALDEEEPPACAKVLARSLQLVELVRRNDAGVRGKRPLGDQTIVRRFSRSFFDAVGSSVALSEADILEQEEELEDGDILATLLLEGEEDLDAEILRLDSLELEVLEVKESDIVDAS